MSEPKQNTTLEKLKDNIYAVIGFVLLAGATIIYQVVRDTLDMTEIFAILFFVLILFIVFLFLSDLIVNRKKKFEEDKQKEANIIYTKFEEKYKQLEEIEANIKEATDILIKKQQIIDQKLLGLIEKQAQEVWVITTSLATEIGDKNLQDDILDNFRTKPNLRYTYFIPHPDSSFDEVQSNLKAFKRLKLYQDYQERIDIIPLSVETQFLLEEVVIYNPHGRYLDIENDKDYSGINGFTYYNQDGKNLHMKLDINMLRHLKSNLEKKLSSTGLTLAVEKIFTKYQSYLNDEQRVYLSSLLKENSVNDKNAFQKFEKTFDNKEHPYDAIRSILSRFITFKTD